MSGSRREPAKDNPVGIALGHLLKWLANPADTFSREVVEMSPFAANLRADFGGQWQQVWEGLLAVASERGFAAMVERVLKNGWADWSDFGRRRAGDVMMALASFDAQGGATPHEAAEWIERLEVSQSPGVAAVQVMTIHKAKGLGFDVVILPEVPNDRVPSSQYFEVAEGDGWITQTPPKWARALIPGTNLLSAAATLTVTPDTTAPAVTNAAFAGMHRIALQLSEAVTAASATNLINYSITNAAGAPLSIVRATQGSVSNRVILTTAVPASGGAYSLVVTGLTDIATAANSSSTPQIVPLNAWVRSPGFLFTEVFTNIVGTTVTNLTNSAKFNDVLPERTGYATNFNITSTNTLGFAADNFGARISGFFVPPTNGSYTFHLRSDDASQLFLNTNSVNSEDPLGATLIAREDSCCKSYGDATSGGPRFGTVSNMVAGQRYYMEGLLKDGTVNDYLMVNVVAAGGATPANSTAMDRTFFETYAPAAAGSLAFAVSPVMPSVNSGSTAAFTGSATNAPSSLDGVVFYQWSTNGLIVPLANGGSFITTPVTVANSAAQYRLIASIPGLSITSAVATVNLNPTAVADSLTTDSNVVLVVFAPKLALNDSDPDGDALTVAAVSATSTAGGTVTLSGSVIYYTPVAGFTGSDGFTYTLNDGRGGTTTGSVLLSVGPASGVSLNLASVGLQAGQPRVTFFGIPGFTYYIQTAPDVGGPWTTAVPLQADSKGRIIFLDAEDPLPPQRFYRTSTTP